MRHKTNLEKHKKILKIGRFRKKLELRSLIYLLGNLVIKIISL